MKQVVKYVAHDGSQWNSKEDAEAREILVDKIKVVMSKLPELHISGHNFYQHIPADVLSVQAKIAALAHKTIGWENGADKHHYEAVVYADKPMGAYSIIGRFISDSGGPLNGAWGRIMCIDSKFREWEQPYYTNNTPPDATEIKR